MSEKLTAKHLEILVRLATSKEPINYQKFLPDLIPVIDLMEYHLVNKTGEYYELSSKGEEYFNKILQYASKHFKKDRLNSLN